MRRQNARRVARVDARLFDVLHHAPNDAPTPVGVDTLADFVWGDQESTNKRTLVQVYVSYVRKKLAASAKVALRFSRGAGYEFLPRSERDKAPVKARSRNVS